MDQPKKNLHQEKDLRSQIENRQTEICQNKKWVYLAMTGRCMIPKSRGLSRY